MSRSRIDYDKGRRDQLGREAMREIAQEQAATDGPPEMLVQAAKGEDLKSSLYTFARSKGISAELFQRVFNLIRHAKLYVFAEETRAGGKTWCECRM